MCWARIVSVGNRCYAPWLNDAMTARSGRHHPCTNTRFHHVCAHTWLGPHDWAHTTVPRHDCAQTWLCPDTIVSSHNCAQTRLCPDTIVPRHDCAAQTQLCPDTIVPRHDCAQTRLCPDTIVPRHDCAQTHLICAQTWLCPDKHELLWSDIIMSLVNNNIIIVFTRLIMFQLDWWKHKHAQLLLAKRSVII